MLNWRTAGRREHFFVLTNCFAASSKRLFSSVGSFRKGAECTIAFLVFCGSRVPLGYSRQETVT